MKCSVCGNEEVFMGEIPLCPKCNKLSVLPKDVALQVVKKQVDWFNRAFYDVLRTFNKKRLIVWLLGKREKIATSFFVDKPEIQLDNFLAVNILIKRVMKDGNENGEKEANERNTQELIDLFSTFINVEERCHIINEGFGCYVQEKDLELDKLDSKTTLMSNFKIFYTDEWIEILKTFGDHLIMSKSKGEEYFDKYKEEYEKIKNTPQKPRHLSPAETISSLFLAFQSFFVSLTKNKLYAETFDFDYLKQSNISPDRLLDLLKLISQKSGLMSMCSEMEFLNIIKKTFVGSREQIIFRKLVFNQENQGIFPIFVGLGDNILTSPDFLRLISIYYSPIFYKKLFDSEISKRGDDFEKIKVPDKFKSLGFNVCPSIMDKKKSKLEIDGLVWKNDILYVLECKIWDIKTYFEHKRIHLYRKRDLMGIVDGKSYTTKDGKTIEKDIPSLLEKINFIKENLTKYCSGYNQIKKIEGLIVIKSRPPIKDYKGIKIKHFGELENLS